MIKYKYRLIIEDTNKNQEILEVAGHGATQNQQTCLKSIRREINSSIRKILADPTKEESI